MHTDSYQFSKREKDVVNLLLQGKGNKQIALALGISNRTVEFHLRNIYTKLDVASRAEAIVKLAKSRLGESTGYPTGKIQVKPTVEMNGASIENGIQSILRRITMKKSYYAAGGIVLTITLIIVLIAVNVATRTPGSTSPGSTPIKPIPTIPIERTPTIPPATSTATLPVSTENTPPTDIVFPAHTVNGYTAEIESYYADTARVIFQVRITGGNVNFGNEHFYDRISSPDLYDESGNLINSSGGWGPAIDPALIQFEFVPLTLFRGNRLKGQFTFGVNDAPAYDQTLAQFRFDFDLPIHTASIFNPKQIVNANGIDILLDQITVTPMFTQIYLCYPSPSFADWLIDSEAVLELDGQTTTPYSFHALFDSAIGGDRRAGSEPYWAPPVKDGRCLKSSFAIGSANPPSLRLTIPQLIRSDPDVLLTDQLVTAYPGMSPKQAYHKYLEEHGNIHKGPWIFNIELVP
ncbi:MAG TPA: response regulator transcription factor [Anaerolineales bacterium]|nr:response regulator transcription factor [Anaerolineales bacterium]